MASRGIFQFYINGKKVGNDFWGTGWTDYKTRIQTNTYDITKMLWRGKNTFGAIIADGWYSGRMSSDKKSRGFYGDRPEILAQIEVEYADGSRETVATDASWKYSFGAILYSDIYDGEAYDARREMPDWNKNGFDDSAWKTPAEKNVEAKPLLEPRRNQPIVIKDILTPVSVRKVAKGTYIFDLGQNIAGWARIKIPARYGKTVRLRFAEMLQQDGTLYTDNYRSALSEDFYTSAGGIRPDEWEPLFTYHGFRYVELSGLSDEIEPQTDWVSGVVLYNDMPDTGSFFCSKPKINALQNCIRWGQRANFFSTPTDCPQRDERLGWTGDAQVFVPTAAFNMDVSAFFTKWTLDLADSAKKFGAPAAIAPAVFGAQGRAAWADAIAICPWEIYAAFGDKKILENNYEAIAGWVEYMRKTSKDLIRRGLRRLAAPQRQAEPRPLRRSQRPHRHGVFCPQYGHRRKSCENPRQRRRRKTLRKARRRRARRVRQGLRLARRHGEKRQPDGVPADARIRHRPRNLARKNLRKTRFGNRARRIQAQHGLCGNAAAQPRPHAIRQNGLGVQARQQRRLSVVDIPD